MFDLKHHPYHPCDDCSDGWEFNDDINNDNTATTDIVSDDSQPSIFFDDKPDREFDDDITSQFIFDLEAKTVTDDVTVATESIVFDNKPDKKIDDDDSETDSQKQLHYDDHAYFLEQLKNLSKIWGPTCQKAHQANDCTIYFTYKDLYLSSW